MKIESFLQKHNQLSAFLETKVSAEFFTPEAGMFLKDTFFDPGARYHWNRKLDLTRGETLDPRHFINQFVEAGA